MKLPSSLLKSLAKKMAAVDASVVVFNPAEGSLTAAGFDYTVVSFSSALRDETASPSEAVDRRQFCSICSRLAGEVELALTAQALTIVTSKSRFQLALSKASLASIPEASTSDYSLATLKQVLLHAASACDSKQRFSYEGSIQLSPRAVESALSGKLILSAAGTDGARLAVAEEAFDKGGPASLLIPSAIVDAIDRLEGEVVRIGETDACLIFSTGDHVSGQIIVAKKLAREFPDFRKLLPKTSKFCATAKIQDLREALDTLEPIVSADDLKKVELNFADEVLQLRACVSGSVGEETIDYNQVTPDPILDGPTPFAVGVNHKFLSEFCSGIKDGLVEFLAENTTAPLLLRAGNRSLLVATVR